MKICFATNNTHKIKEIQSLLGDSFEIRSLAEIGCEETLPETQPTIGGNSLQKAQYVWEHYQVDCFADDTGLEVEALNQAPGVYSGRYAGEPRSDERNLQLLLKNLSTATHRKARFITWITLIIAGQVHQFEGVVKGEITQSPKGEEGFGYDPVFQPLGFDKTFGEMTLQEKNKVSHRARAFQKLIEFLRKSM
ncbi:MAG: RdgB/HAM1 family non-canonical purine NTP pyrophosphatase [Bacteroidota bacterium]